MVAWLRRAAPPVLAFAVPFAVYVRTLAPSVATMDSGELAAVATTLGVAHPTGYPLFTLLAHAWTWAPLPGSPIQRLNLFAAFCVAVSAALFYGVMLQIIGRLGDSEGTASSRPLQPPPAARVCALATAWTYAFGRTVWDQATSVEVYALHLVLSLLAVLLFLRAALDEAPRRRDWLAFAFAFGLGFTNHLTTIVLVPAMLFLLVHRLGFGKRLWRVLALGSLPFILALSFYVYLPLRSAAAFPFHSLGPPIFDWGGVARGWDKFVYHVLGRQYKVWMFSGAWRRQLQRFALLLPGQVGVLGLVLLPVGLWSAVRRARPLGVWLALLLVAPLAWALNYEIPDIDPYFLVTFAAAVLAAGAGGFCAVRARPRLAWLLFVLPLASLGLNWRHADRSREFAVLDFTTNLLAHVAPNAIVVSTEAAHFDLPFWYLQQVAGVRRDVTVISLDLLRRTWYPDQLRRWRPEVLAPAEAEFALFGEDLDRFEAGRPFDRDRLQARYLAAINALIDRNCGARPVYVTPGVIRAAPDVARQYAKTPAGFALQLSRPGDPAPPLVDRFELERLIATPLDPEDLDTRSLLDSVFEGVERTRRHAAALGRTDEVRRLGALAGRLAARLH